jgi:hypothetical protein
MSPSLDFIYRVFNAQSVPIFSPPGENAVSSLSAQFSASKNRHSERAILKSGILVKAPPQRRYTATAYTENRPAGNFSKDSNANLWLVLNAASVCSFSITAFLDNPNVARLQDTDNTLLQVVS